MAGQVLLLVKSKSKLGSVRNLFWFPSLWVQAISEFVHSVLWVFPASFLRPKAVCFFSGRGGSRAPEVIWLVDFPCSLKKWSWHLGKHLSYVENTYLCFHAFALHSSSEPCLNRDGTHITV